ncbi:predicted protein [Sclerotinia sclerotiorum 1980 UF-70]|uniref:Uncharacterized protein n=1 Tax=Sclerotinia sclerotiorum (strain ATCC 18683 / 1980 / Ss-1) TaxID=665079 RepID=A7ETM5_SCLS1|nr:predicted protein [Sclerotinia sclerotiorum 1980 UF-70]EDN92817.1 predicted protein [Sclerotinia sclerotiorum 1980 UF-70]
MIRDVTFGIVRFNMAFPWNIPNKALRVWVMSNGTRTRRRLTEEELHPIT